MYCSKFLETPPTASYLLIFVFQRLFLEMNDTFTAQHYMQYYGSLLVPDYSSFSQVPDATIILNTATWVGEPQSYFRSISLCSSQTCSLCVYEQPQYVWINMNVFKILSKRNHSSFLRQTHTRSWVVQSSQNHPINDYSLPFSWKNLSHKAHGANQLTMLTPANLSSHHLVSWCSHAECG